jgi:hypothetical protein
LRLDAVIQAIQQSKHLYVCSFANFDDCYSLFKILCLLRCGDVLCSADDLVDGFDDVLRGNAVDLVWHCSFPPKIKEFSGRAGLFYATRPTWFGILSHLFRKDKVFFHKIFLSFKWRSDRRESGVKKPVSA